MLSKALNDVGDERVSKGREATKTDALAKLKAMDGVSLDPVYAILTCRPQTPMFVQWRVAFDAIRLRGFVLRDVLAITGKANPRILRLCDPFPQDDVVSAFSMLLGGIPAERIFPCLRNDAEFQAHHAKDYVEAVRGCSAGNARKHACAAKSRSS